MKEIIIRHLCPPIDIISHVSSRFPDVKLTRVCLQFLTFLQQLKIVDIKTLKVLKPVCLPR